MEQGKLFTDKYIVNGHGCHDDVMTMDELDTLLFSGSEFEVKAYSVKKQEEIKVEDGE
jgi:hypothetical protein